MTSLMHFLAGRGRLEILTQLQENPRAPYTINELSRRTRVPLGTTWLAVRDLQSLGLVLLDRVGNAALVRPNLENPVWQSVEALLALDLPSPHQTAYDFFVRRLKARLPGVSTRLFGSVARGEERPDSDVDVEVVYGESDHDRETVQQTCAKVSNETLDQYRISVVPIVSRRSMVT